MCGTLRPATRRVVGLNPRVHAQLDARAARVVLGAAGHPRIVQELGLVDAQVVEFRDVED